MTDHVTSQPPAGWYNDPEGLELSRWWNGQAWTEHTTAMVPTSSVPLASSGYAVEVVEAQNATATTSLVLGIVAAGLGLTMALIPLAILPGIVAIVFGFIGESKSKQIGGRGHAASLWGVFLGFIPGLLLLLQVSMIAIGNHSGR